MNVPVHRSFRLWVFFSPSSGQIPLNAGRGENWDKALVTLHGVCVRWSERKRPNLFESVLVGGTHVVTGQHRLLRTWRGGGWRGRPGGRCPRWLWPGRRPASRGSCCGGGRRRHGYEQGRTQKPASLGSALSQVGLTDSRIWRLLKKTCLQGFDSWLVYVHCITKLCKSLKAVPVFAWKSVVMI